VRTAIAYAASYDKSPYVARVKDFLASDANMPDRAPLSAVAEASRRQGGQPERKPLTPSRPSATVLHACANRVSTGITERELWRLTGLPGLPIRQRRGIGEPPAPFVLRSYHGRGHGDGFPRRDVLCRSRG
jgi:hypothetical protein